MLTNIPFLQYLTNSLVVAVGTTVGSLVLGILAGYGFVRFRFRGSEAVRFLVLVTRMVPRTVLVVPYFLMMQKLGLLDTYTGLVIAYISFALPFTIWLLIGFFVGRAARDGGSRPDRRLHPARHAREGRHSLRRARTRGRRDLRVPGRRGTSSSSR